MLCLREKKPSDLVNVSLVFWVTAAEQNASNAGKPGWAPGQKRVAGLRETQAGAGLSGARPKADPCRSQTVLPGASQELIPSQTLKGRVPSRASPRTCPDRRALARSRAAPVRTRERAVPEAGHAVAGISPAPVSSAGRSQLRRSQLAGPAVFPRARPPRTPRWDRQRRRRRKAAGPRRESSLSCSRASEPTAARRERGRRWKAWRLRCWRRRDARRILDLLPSQLLCFHVGFPGC